MLVCIWVYMSVLLRIADGFIVRGSSAPLVVPLGASVVLPCSVDKPLLIEGLEVEWRRTDSETLVHLFEDGESRPETQQQDYYDRAHFFTEEIQHGNFSLLLNNVRHEDKGGYRCTVHSDQDSAETVIEIKDVERLIVSGSNHSISVYAGEDVTLSCSVDSHIPPEEIEQVSWKRADEDILVLLFQSNEIIPESSDERYRDRAEFFTDEIPKGNFSLRLKSVRTEDKGVYMCEVFAGGVSANTIAVLERTGFSTLHIMALILCITSSGSALLICCLIYCRSQYYKGLIVKHERDPFIPLRGSVVLPCFIDPQLLKKELKVEWRRTDSETLVHLYQDGESRPETQHQDYHDRAHFFTEEIQHGNFSLLLNNVRAEDKGEYKCTVHSEQDCVFSISTSLELGSVEQRVRGSDFVHTIYKKQENNISVESNLVLGFKVQGSGRLVVPLGCSVVLPCSGDKSFQTISLKVEWRRTDSETLVHLFQDGESRPETQQQDYHDRAHFFTEEIQHGNFSLLLNNVRAEDKGGYRCTVHSEQDSAETVIEIKDVERLIVSGSNHSISAYAGEDVTLSCSVDSHIPPEEIDEVSWKKTDDGNILVLVIESNEIKPESAHERYRDRVEFFTDEIPKGNFSLRLKSVRTEDKGVYMCQVTAGDFLVNTTVVLEQMGFSGLHIMVLILCIAASGSALLICSLIYCRSNNTVLHFQVSLVFCPNIIMLFAFVFWGVSEGSVIETVSCCALYFLRPLMLLWAAPYVKQFTGNIKTWILYWSAITEYIIFSTVIYSVLFKYALDKGLSYAGFEGIMIIVLFVIALLFCLFIIIYMFGRISGKLSKRIKAIFNVLAGISFDILPALQFILLFYAFGARGGFFIVAVLPVLTSVTRYNWDITCGQDMGCSPLVRRSVWVVVMLLMNAVMVYFYITALENEKDRVGWGCVVGFLQLLWTVYNFSYSFVLDFLRTVSLYLFGSVVLVLLNSVGLMTELILKTVNGKGLVGDLRIVVFSSECLFVFILLILLVFNPVIPKITQCVQSCQNAVRSNQTPDTRSEQNQSSQNAAGHDEPSGSRSNQNQNTAGSHEMKTLLETQNQETGRSGEERQTPSDSVV